MIKKEDEIVGTIIINREVLEVLEFEELLQRFKCSISVLGKSELTFKSYAKNIATIALHFGKISTKHDVEQVEEYLLFTAKVF